jgi:hypothetical protein
MGFPLSLDLDQAPVLVFSLSLSLSLSLFPPTQSTFSFEGEVKATSAGQQMRTLSSSKLCISSSFFIWCHPLGHFLTAFFLMCSWMIHPQEEDLAKFGYKLNIRSEIFKNILL